MSSKRKGGEIVNIPIHKFMNNLSRFVEKGFFEETLEKYIYRKIPHTEGGETVDYIVDLVWGFYSSK